MGTIFEDYEGNGSSMNLVWTVSIIVIVGVWIATSFMAGSLQHVTGGDALWFTSLFAGKTLQGFFEKKMPIPKIEGKSESTVMQDPKGKFNTQRFVWILAVLGIVGIWAVLSIKNIQIQHFTTGDAAWFTALFASKVGGTYIERQDYDRSLVGKTDEGDSDEDGIEGQFISGQSNTDKDNLIAQLQETVRVQSDFNKNLVNKINKD